MRWSFAGLYVALTLVYARPLFTAFTTALPHDSGDPGLNAWILWWNTREWPFTDAWWNAPIFFPLPGAFAMSETLLSMTPLTTPLQWLGVGPVAAYNVAFLISFPASALAAHLLAYRLTGRHDAALLAGLAFGFNPYRAAQLPHIQMLWSFWMPLALVALHRYLESSRLRYLALAGLCWTLNAFSAGYYLVFFAVLLALWMVWFVRSGRDFVRIAVTMALASLPLVPLLAGYARHQDALGAARSRNEIESFSADLSAVWAVSPHAWLPAHWTLTPRPEGELYPGIVILALAAAGVIAAWRRSPRPWRPEPRKGFLTTGAIAIAAAFLVWITGGFSGQLFGVPLSVTRPHRLVGIGIWLVVIALAGDRRLKDAWRRRSTFGFYALAAIAMFAFALGPVGRAFDARFMDRAPYFWLMQLPGGESLRVPARFAMLLALCLSQAAALAFARLSLGGARALAAGALSVLILADGWVPRFPIAPVETGIDLQGLDPAAAVLEVPRRHLYDDTAAMLRATTHRRPLVNGFSGYFPAHYGPFQVAMQSRDPTLFEAVRQLTPLIIIVNRANDTDAAYMALVTGLRDVHLERETSIGPAYSLKQTPPPARTPGARLAIAAVEATDNPTLAGAMVDDSLDTRWETLKPQTPGIEVTVTLERASTVSRIEIDLGGLERTYPRLLRVGVQRGDEAPARAFEGEMGGYALLGALRDRRRTTLAIDLPQAVTGQRIVLSSAGSDPDDVWSIAELRVFGSEITMGTR